MKYGTNVQNPIQRRKSVIAPNVIQNCKRKTKENSMLTGRLKVHLLLINELEISAK